jgi:hypothetical protein
MRKAPVTVWIGGPDRARAERAQEAKRPVRKALARKRSNGTINHRLNALRAALNCAWRARDPLTGKPMIPAPPLVPKLKVEEHLPRPISDADLERIGESLRPTAPHVADAAVLVRHMGFRRGPRSSA